MMKKHSIFQIIITLLPIAISAAEKKTLIFGVHPLYNPQKVVEKFGPICQLMTKQTSFKCVIEPTKDYAQYNTLIKEKYFDVLMPNPLQTIKSLNFGYEIFAKWANDQQFKGIILVRSESGISKLSDLKGKLISFPAPTALAAALMPQYDLALAGLFPEKDYKSVYVGSQDSSILSVFNNSSDAGATWIPPWEIIKIGKPDVDKKLRVLHETQSLPNNGLIYRSSFSKKEKNEIKKFFINFNNFEGAKEILENAGIEGFDPAVRSTYDPVKTFLSKYEKIIGKVQW